MHDPITYFQALILGIVQGLTEFCPSLQVRTCSS